MKILRGYIEIWRLQIELLIELWITNQILKNENSVGEYNI